MAGGPCQSLDWQALSRMPASTPYALGGHHFGILMKRMTLLPSALAICIVQCLPMAGAHAQDSVELETIEVTSAKLPVNLRDSTATVTVVSGDDLRARGATDLRTALTLVAGVDIAPGGDGGPASSVPALWGLREFDAFLLVVDGTPWGGAFTPALATLDLNNVDRIEVMKGAAPVSYGATSFVGVIHVLHRAAGKGPASVEAGFGSRGSARFARGAAAVLRGPAVAAIAVRGCDHQDLAPDRSGWSRCTGCIVARRRSARATSPSTSIASRVEQEPVSPHPREGATLSARVPLDANDNPARRQTE